MVGQESYFTIFKEEAISAWAGFHVDPIFWSNWNLEIDGFLIIYLFILLIWQNIFTVRGILQKEKYTTASYSYLYYLDIIHVDISIYQTTKKTERIYCTRI